MKLALIRFGRINQNGQQKERIENYWALNLHLKS
jgi:hypothetical protein